jgi:hypothetical protein
MLFAQPSNLWLLATAVGRAPLRDAADDLLKLTLLRAVRANARVMGEVESKTKTLLLVSGPVGADGRRSPTLKDDDINRIIWDNSAVSDYVYAPVVFGRRLTVFLGAGGVHEFTAIRAMPRSARKAILRRLDS